MTRCIQAGKTLQSRGKPEGDGKPKIEDNAEESRE